ncbi:MAG TPA: hypothetical protein VK186_04160, partial [Candidatus Deferrimicrobium sp.]|nr:hypothetical protein [Candidatus Deferrimicrobium sp.]
MKNLLDLEKNRDYLKTLINNKKNLVPFLGAGFSNPTCPGWEDFLLNYFASLKKDNALLPKEITAFDEFKAPGKPNRLEGMADFLVEKYPGPGFKAEMRRQM